MPLRNIFFRLVGNHILNKIEQAILDEVRNNLPISLSEKFQSQLDCINKVQRFTSGKEVNMYLLKRGKPVDDNCSRLWESDAETLLAQVWIVDEMDRRLIARVWIVNGRLFSLAFDHPPGELGRTYQIVKVKIFPSLDIKLPKDYEDIVRLGKTAELKGWSVFEPSHMREVVLDDGNYYVVAEYPTFGYIAIRESEANQQLYLLLLDEGKVIPCGNSLKGALKHAENHRQK